MNKIKTKADAKKLAELFTVEHPEANPNWIAIGWAAPCEYGIYPLTNQDTSVVEVIK